MLKKTLALEHIKQRLLRHWGTTPGLNFIYAHIVMDVMDRVPKMQPYAKTIKQTMLEKLHEHKAYIETYGQDMPEILGWKWKA